MVSFYVPCKKHGQTNEEKGKWYMYIDTRIGGDQKKRKSVDHAQYVAHKYTLQHTDYR
jgi:hypothetical protein